MVAENDTLLRREEQRTGPNVHYLDTLPEALEPGVPERPETYIWSERPATKPEPWPASIATAPNVRTVLDAGHKVQWGWPVAAYLVTKGVAAGVAMLSPFAELLGLRGWPLQYGVEIVALLFTVITTFLLVEDLHRPLKFLTLLTRPNKKSWLVKGAWILMAFSATVSATLACSWLSSQTGLPSGLDRVPWDQFVMPLRWINALLGLGVAGYTAFLFAQCEGRDLWQSKLLLPHLLVQALACGAVVLLFFSGRNSDPLRAVAMVALLAHAVFSGLERRMPHSTANARQAAAFLGVVRWGRVKAWIFAMFVGVIGAMPLINSQMSFVAFVPVLLGLFVYEYAFVRAAQLPPLS
jgi:formate-dependent nitrite reductase membrane component NrfD